MSKWGGFMRKFIAAAVQMDTGNDKKQNLQQMLQYIEEAARHGANLVVFPEVATILSEAEVHAEPIPGPTTRLLAQKAKECGIWVHGGSMSELNPNGPRTYNTSVLMNPADLKHYIILNILFYSIELFRMFASDKTISIWRKSNRKFVR